MVVVIAALGLKGRILYRSGQQTTSIISLSNVLRNPGSKLFITIFVNE
jgi:hypothetical protein